MVGLLLDVGFVADVPATVADAAVSSGVRCVAALSREPHAPSGTSEEMAAATNAKVVRFISALVSESQAVRAHAATAVPDRSIATKG
jgi:hypothetical protein